MIWMASVEQVMLLSYPLHVLGTWLQRSVLLAFSAVLLLMSICLRSEKIAKECLLLSGLPQLDTTLVLPKFAANYRHVDSFLIIDIVVFLIAHTSVVRMPVSRRVRLRQHCRLVFEAELAQLMNDLSN